MADPNSFMSAVTAAAKSPSNQTFKRELLPDDTNPGFNKVLQAVLSGIGFAPELGVSDSQEHKDLAKTVEVLDLISNFIPGSAAIKSAPLMVGMAFRPRTSVLGSLTRKSLIEHTSERMPPLSKKEISKYGTDEFLLDDFLPSTRYPREWETYLDRYAGRFPEDFSDMEDVLNLRAGKEVFDMEHAVFDVNGAKEVFNEEVARYSSAGRLPPDFGKKQLNQQVAAVKALQLKDASTEAAKLQKAIDIVSGRTAEKRKIKDFVQLDDLQDLSDETHFLNICIGQSAMDNGKAIPALDVITGKPNKINGPNYGESYYNSLLSGKKKYFSYRPNGVPEFTVEVEATPLGRDITQAYGKDNASLTTKQSNALEELLSSPEYISLFPRR